MTELDTETIAAAAAKSPATRISLQDIEDNIKFEKYANLADLFPNLPKEAAGPLGTITQCYIIMENGFVVIGTSACADPANYNYEAGCKIAKADAVRQIWPLMGYEMRTKLK